MAVSTETFLKEVIGDLEVIDLYKELMTVSTEQDSLYIKAKETLQSMFETGDFTGSEKSAIIAQTIAGIANGTTATILESAIAIAKENRDAPYVLAKLKEETILLQEQQNKLATENDLAAEDVKLKTYTGWKLQGELVRDFGIKAYELTLNDDIVALVRYDAAGIKYEAERQARANVYNTYASSYRGNGFVSVNLNADGSLAATTTADTNGLTHAQTNVAIRQEQGFDDNMRQHVANSSATMMSMLLSTEASGINYTPYLAQWSTSIDYLNGL